MGRTGWYQFKINGRWHYVVSIYRKMYETRCGKVFRSVSPDCRENKPKDHVCPHCERNVK